MKLSDNSLFRRQCYIDGAWADADNGATFDVLNPADGSVLGTVPEMGAAETARAIDAADAAFPGWAAKTAKERSQVLRRWFDLIVENRRRIGEWYADGLSGISGVEAPFEPPYARVNHQSYVVRLADPSRQMAIMQSMKNAGIPTRPGITCIHREKPYARAWPAGSLPETEKARIDRILLPLHPRMTEEDVSTVIQGLKDALDG